MLTAVGDFDDLLSLPPREAERVALDLLKDRYTSSLYHTAKHLLGYRDVTWFTHGRIIETLESNSTHKLICVPRGCFKSSVATVSYPIWKLLKNPNLRILIDSEVYSNAKNFLHEIKNHLVKDQITRLFGQFRSSDKWKEGEIVIAQRVKKALKEPTIACSGIGAEKTSQHYDIIIADDLNSKKNSKTVEGRQKVIEHYKAYTSLLEPGGTIVVVGTRYAKDDVIGHILAHEMGIEDESGLIV